MISKRLQAIQFGLGAIALAVSSLAQADPGSVTIDVTGILSNGAFGDAGNTVMNFNIGAGAHVTSVDYNVTMTAFDPSYLSEMRVAFTATDPTVGAYVAPGYQYRQSGTVSVSGSLLLADYGLDFNVDGTGLLRAEFYEGYLDGASPDGIWNSGTVTVHFETAAPVPEPSTYGLMALGLAALGTVARRRRLQQ